MSSRKFRGAPLFFLYKMTKKGETAGCVLQVGFAKKIHRGPGSTGGCIKVALGEIVLKRKVPKIGLKIFRDKNWTVATVMDLGPRPAMEKMT